jgi:hypothetical protein
MGRIFGVPYLKGQTDSCPTAMLPVNAGGYKNRVGQIQPARDADTELNCVHIRP